MIKFLIAVLAVLCFFVTGCQKAVEREEIVDRFYMTDVKLSTSADVLSVIVKEDLDEHLSQSESVVASWGQDEKGYHLWFNMVAFDEEQLTAVGKYCLIIKDKKWFQRPMIFSEAHRLRLTFDAELVLDQEILEEPYANENTKQIAIIEEVFTKITDAATHVKSDSQNVTSQAMLLAQVGNTIKLTLAESPGLASDLPKLKGLRFDHITLDKGRVRMLIEDDIVKLKIKIGKDEKKFEELEDVMNM